MPNPNLFELDRVTIRVVRDSGGPLISNTPLNSPGKVAKLLHDKIFGDLDREIFAVVNLKTSLAFAGMKVLAADGDDQFQNLYPASINVCSMGSLNESIVHPREVLKSSILQNASHVFLVHFHPSGQLEPSDADIQVTDRLIKAYDLMGIPVLDHIILGPQEQYYSFHENDILPLPDNQYTTNLADIAFSGQLVAEPTPETGENESVLDRLQNARAECAGSKFAEGKPPGPEHRNQRKTEYRTSLYSLMNCRNVVCQAFSFQKEVRSLNIFDAVKDGLNTRDVVEAYGIQVRRNGMCCCPFHGDKNPSMKVDAKRFHCFGCCEDGDVIQFAAKYFDLSRYEAAKKLAEDFGISYDYWKPERDEKGKPLKPKPRPKSAEQIYREKEHHFFREISDHYHRLRDWKETYKPKNMDEEWDDRFAEALDYIPRLEMIMDAFLAADRSGREELFQAHAETEHFCEQRNREAKEDKNITEGEPNGSREEEIKSTEKKRSNRSKTRLHCECL